MGSALTSREKNKQEQKIVPPNFTFINLDLVSKS